MPPPAMAPALPDELVEEIFLRLPPEEPASLVRASLASKPWLGLLTGQRFRGRYRDFHGSPPMLGFFYAWHKYSAPEEVDTLPPMVSTTNLGKLLPDDKVWVSDYPAWDCHHGRVLLCDLDMELLRFIIWDPITGCRSELCAPHEYDTQQAVVLCALSSGCDHRACHEGPFRVIFIGLENYDDDGCVAYAHVSSSKEAGKWRKPCATLYTECDRGFLVDTATVFSQEALYLMLACNDDDDDEDDENDDISILKYDMSSNCLSLIDMPETTDTGTANGALLGALLMSMEDGGLGLATLNRLTLNLWSMQMGSNRVPKWTRRIVINLKELLPTQNIKKRLRLTGSVEGGDIIFVTTDLGIYSLNLKSLKLKKIWKREEFLALMPYMSYYDLRVPNFLIPLQTAPGDPVSQTNSMTPSVQNEGVDFLTM